MLEILIGALIFAAGYMTCFFTVKKEVKVNSDKNAVVKRVMPSLRNPLRTYEVYYENYKSKDNNLYQPIKPKRKASVNEVDTDDV
ncbi:MAG TPA: hypothetical protein PLH43_11955 [Acetivibrio sp.]|uniref:hypothetical protein n=1 Tax=Acetivibrio sp. TaxID=1872092 RepID=UPI002BFAF268|nr:hypothetical protein [Acetivibrio sp.]HOM03519.1 hypothetical protein [Acetivibrio sp.]